MSTDKVKRSQNVRESDRVQQYKAGELDLDLSLILLFVGCRLCGEPLTMRDILCGAQKGAIPYLAAFESLPPSFRVNAADPAARRSAFGTDSNYVSFKELFGRNEMASDWTHFYVLSNLLVVDLDLMPLIVPAEPQLMAMRSLRDCHVPPALYPVTRVILQKYQRFSQCLRLDDGDEVESEWRESAEFDAESVGTTLRFADSFPLKLVFDGESQSQRHCLDSVTIAAIIVVAIQSVYRLDRPLCHRLNERPHSKCKHSAFPPLSSWFGAAADSKWEYLEKERTADLAAMFGAGGLFDDDRSWTLKMTKDFVVRHYRLRPQFAAIHKFVDSESTSILDRNQSRNRSRNAVHGPLYDELMELSSSRIGVKVADLEQRVDAVMMRLLVVFEYDELRANNVALTPMMPLIIGRAPKLKCNRCSKRFGIHLVLQCRNGQSAKCQRRICRQCLLRIYDDEHRVKLLIMRHQAGILRETGWKCPQCQDRQSGS